MANITFQTGGGGFGSKTSIQEASQYAEKLGFDVISFYEHVTNWGPDYDPFIRMAYAASATKRIRVLGLTVLPLHHPVRLAHQITTLDNLSDGRVILVAGVGGEYPKQFEAFGIPVSERGKRADEYIEIMQGLWTQKSFDYHGKFLQFEGITMEPKPVQKPHPPIWIAGRPGGVQFAADGTRQFKSKIAAARRAGKYGQGWFPFSVTVDQVRETVQQVHQFAREAGRDPKEIVIGLNNSMLIRDTYEEALAEARANGVRYGRDISERVSQYDLLGSPEDVIRRMEQYIEVGVTHFTCGSQVEIVSKRIIPYFR